uniref:Protein tyrosine phosphatase n=1 Tax=Panagrolaimus sp. JU765 TaxID=591449 RepID=A0AC34QP84_9BILA
MKKKSTQRKKNGTQAKEKENTKEKKKQASIQQDVDSQMTATTAALPVQPQPGTPAQPAAKCASNARQEVEKWAKRTLDKGVNGLREEFLELKKYIPPDMTVQAFQAHWEAGRNRYKDVPCQDKFRVVLKWPGQSYDYIHANYVIQEDSDNVIMLCNVKEKGMDKCAQYWPLDAKESKVYGDVEVENVATRQLTPDEQTVRLCILAVRWKEGNKTKEREVRHYQWIDWPDRGVPPCRLTAMVLLSHVRGTKKPIIVHCSAGIGRTGTIVALEYILERLQSGLPCEAMDEILKELRNQRPYSIQTDLQYLYVHRVMLFYFFEKYKVGQGSEELQQKYKAFVTEYEKYT